MPSRWWVPVPGIDPRRVRLEHLHAAVSGWFDQTQDDHARLTKPYALSPLSEPDSGPGSLGFEVSVLTEEAQDEMLARVWSGEPVRLGSQTVRLPGASLVEETSWAALSTWTRCTGWELEFLTPAGFRQGRQWSPWPAPAAVLRGLSETWNHWSGCEPRVPTHQEVDAVRVVALAGSSEEIDLGRQRAVGFLGRIRFGVDDPAVAELVDGLFRLAAFSGVGSAKAMGLGVTRVSCLGQQRTQPARRGARTGGHT